VTIERQIPEDVRVGDIVEFTFTYIYKSPTSLPPVKEIWRALILELVGNDEWKVFVLKNDTYPTQNNSVHFWSTKQASNETVEIIGSVDMEDFPASLKERG